MRKFFLGLLIFVVVVVAALAAAPFLFKDKIRQAFDQQLAQRVKAKVQYDPGNVDVTLLSTFPDLSLRLDQLRIIGQDSFSRDTLAYLPRLDVGLDLMSVISGDQIKIKNVTLEQPDISLRVLKSGRANWDVFVSDSAAASKGQDTTAVNLAIKGWQINDGHLRYDDRSIPFAMEARHVNHSGSGDFESNVFDMVSQTTAEQFTMNYDGTDYISKKKLTADVTMAMNLEKMLFTFKDNKVQLNDFPATFQGTVGLPNATDITYDLTFKALETDFKNILSLVPGAYNEQFKDMKAEGKVAFDGYFKGVQNDLKMPGYGVNLQVKNGMFKYPDLPQAARNINVDMNVDNPSGFTNNVKVNVKQFHLDLGTNPVDGNVAIDGLEPMKVDGRVKANVDLAEMTKVYPVQDLLLRGKLFVDGTAKGLYSKTQMPVVQAKMNLTNGYVKSKQFPAPIENLTLNGTVTNPTGQLNDTRVDIPQFRMLLDGEPLAGRVATQGVDKLRFDTDVKGVIDLTKITKIFPLEGMTVTGRLTGDIAAKGNMADIEAGRYQTVVASGTVKAQNVTYKSQDLPQGMKVTQATATFNNDKIVLQNMTGSLGSSDVAASGTISNYMGYLFVPGQPLRGTLSVNSNRFNMNEWMVDEVSAKPTVTAAGKAPAKAEGVLQIPKEFDLVLNTTVGQVLYDNLKLDNVKGTVTVRNQVATLNNLTFNTLGGSFATNGSYSSQNLAHPKFDLGLKIQNLNFQNAFQAFNSIKTLVPLVSSLEGVFSTNFNVSGEMGPDMMPKYSTLTGKGLFEVVRAAVANSAVLNKISSLTQFQELKSFAVNNKDVAAEIINGNFVVKPFDLTVGQIKMTVGGSNNVSTGGLEYVTALNVPTGKLGSQLNSKLTSLTGVQNLQGTDRVTLGLNIGGTVTNPQVKLTTGSVKAQAKDLVSNIVQAKVDDAKLKLQAQAKVAQDSLQRELQRKQQELAEKAKLELDKKRLEAQSKLQNQAKQGLNNILFGKPKTQPAKPAETPKAAEPAPAAQPDSMKLR
ncbi:AsmA family protein [Hymenobacter taeanensis]|uniref:AsmA family protein n=1 Tax=Hymenobacter taeanensis TaxID=2735321 RepID=A0A6M6BDV9_9BACT|nr:MULTISPECIES: AsmA-like C-terminal region-containing protein [Hymenobacter]QJX46711.1 AsmA family protein [Hymenobacter taeanensis]UOQ80577.1 AsmA family protein [Hymenobacter sp. 5414T-23]